MGVSSPVSGSQSSGSAALSFSSILPAGRVRVSSLARRDLAHVRDLPAIPRIARYLPQERPGIHSAMMSHPPRPSKRN